MIRKSFLPLSSDVVGRAQELNEIRELLGRTDQRPKVIVLTGEAGIGKTALWNAAVEIACARGDAVLACGAAAEGEFDYSGLCDLLENVDADMLSLLPEPQSRAVKAALLETTADSSGADSRAVCHLPG